MDLIIHSGRNLCLHEGLDGWGGGGLVFTIH